MLRKRELRRRVKQIGKQEDEQKRKKIEKERKREVSKRLIKCLISLIRLSRLPEKAKNSHRIALWLDGRAFVRAR